MKKLAIYIVLTFFIGFAVPAQTAESCLPNGIIFRYQSQIDNFQADYPNCTAIEGNVYIGCFNDNITNLEGLNALTSIGGSLSIVKYFSANLISLAGLDNLTSIGGDLAMDFFELIFY